MPIPGKALLSDSVRDETGAFYNTAKDRFSFNSSDFGNLQVSESDGSIFIHFLTEVLTLVQHFLHK